MDYNELFQEGTLDTGATPPGPGAVDLTAGGGDFGMFNGGAPEIEAAHVPAASPQDALKRKSGWMKIMEAFQTNPNLQRSLMLVGAQMMQPIQPGQSVGGATANAAIVGMNAYQLGQKEELAQKKGLRAEGREDRRLDLETERLEEQKRTGQVGREATAASTARTIGTTPGAIAESEKQVRTLEDAIALSGQLVERGKLANKEALNESAVAEIERDTRVVKSFFERAIMAGTPVDAKIRQGMAEVAAAEERVKTLRSQGGLADAQARKATADAGVAEAEARMTPEERARSRRTQSTSEEARWRLLSDAWDKSPALKAAHPDKEAWLAGSSTESKRNPSVLLKAINEAIEGLPSPRKGVADPKRVELEEARDQLIREMRGGAPAAPATPASAPPAATKKGAHKAGDKAKSRSGKPITYDGEKWVYD